MVVAMQLETEQSSIKTHTSLLFFPYQISNHGSHLYRFISIVVIKYDIILFYLYYLHYKVGRLFGWQAWSDGQGKTVSIISIGNDDENGNDDDDDDRKEKKWRQWGINTWRNACSFSLFPACLLLPLLLLLLPKMQWWDLWVKLWGWWWW